MGRARARTAPAQAEGKNDGKNLRGSSEPLTHQQLGRLVDDRVGMIRRLSRSIGICREVCPSVRRPQDVASLRHTLITRATGSPGPDGSNRQIHDGESGLLQIPDTVTRYAGSPNHQRTACRRLRRPRGADSPERCQRSREVGKPPVCSDRRRAHLAMFDLSNREPGRLIPIF